MYHSGAQAFEVGGVDLDFAAPNKLQEVGVVVQDTEAVASEHGQSPWFQLGGLGM